MISEKKSVKKEDSIYIVPDGSLISYFSNKVKTSGGINLAQGIPGFSPPAELLQSLSDIAVNPGIHQYAPGTGNHKLAGLIRQHYGADICGPDNLLIVQGATEAITLLYIYLRTQNTGIFSVMAFNPVYETYNNLPAIFGDKFVSQNYNADNSIDFELLENNIEDHEVKLLFMNSPGNPFGRVFSKEEIQAIIRLSEKYGFSIIFDAVYRDFYFGEKPYIPYYPESDQVFYVNSFSKKLSITGWRIGYLICSEKHMKRLRSVHDYTGLCVASVLQEAVANYLEKSAFGKEYSESVKARLIKAYQAYKPELESLGFEVPDSNGGYFIWAKLPTGFDNDFRFAVDLYDIK
ncbi:MAG: hypothetical protein CVU05_15160, partial [Bacteroidetes bacterium HGW-Bacteroidetes-21]